MPKMYGGEKIIKKVRGMEPVKEAVVKGRKEQDILQLTPEYVLQHHAISRSIYNLKANARKLIAMGMALIPSDMSKLTATFSLFDFCQALGLEPSGMLYTITKEAILECVGTKITIETPKEWQTFTWVQTAKIDKETNFITITFSTGLIECIAMLKKMYTRFELRDFGNLQSLYAIRLFELAKSYESLAGQQGNKPNCWFFERSIKELREILGVEEGTYTKMNDFKIKVIEKPIKEINSSNLGLTITTEYIRKGKYLVAIRFLCQKEARKVQSRKKKGAAALSAPEKFPLDDHSLAEKELERIKKLYPEEYAERYADILAHPTTNFLRDNPRLWAGEADRLACQALKARHGIQK